MREIVAKARSGFDSLTSSVREILKDEDGATVIEYVLITALIGVALIAGFTALQENVSNTLSTVGSAIK